MMFGHDDHNDEHKNNGPAPDGMLTPDNVAEPVTPPALPNDDDAAGDFIMTDTPTAMPQGDNHSDSTDDTVVPAPPVVTKPAAISAAGNDDLLQIKQEAMNALSPLLDHLEQSPEEKFRTTMMMIQAADNDKLIPVAYEAAKAIPDEKARAQALLDIVNEINYFTQAADADKA
jgi:hypothetical protein